MSDKNVSSCGQDPECASTDVSVEQGKELHIQEHPVFLQFNHRKESYDWTQNFHLQVKGEKTGPQLKLNFFANKTSNFDEHVLSIEIHFTEPIEIDNLNIMIIVDSTAFRGKRIFFTLTQAQKNQFIYKSDYQRLKSWRNTFVTLTNFRMFYQFKNVASFSNLVNLSTFLLTGEYSDLTITVGEEKFKVHKIILARHSEVFKKMIDTDMKEGKENSINIPNFDSAIIKEALNFLYEGKCNFEVNPHKIFCFAHLFQTENLIKECKIYLLNNINEKNILECIKLAKVYSCDLQVFKEKIDYFISINEQELIKDNQFIEYHLRNLDSNNVHWMFKWVMKYCELADKINDVKVFISENLSEVMKNEKIRLLMTERPSWSLQILDHLGEKEEFQRVKRRKIE